MEWGGLLVQVLMLGGFLIWEGYCKQKGRNLAEREDSKEIAMLKKMGEDIATKKDIGEITKEVESVKVSYNESLERHKIELQKELETSKYIINLCNSLDNNLVVLLVNCRDAISKENKEYDCEDSGSSIDSCLSLCDFLHSYQTRYGNNENVQLIMNERKRLEDADQSLMANYKIDSKDYWKGLNAIYDNANILLKLFLPELPPK